MRFPHTKCRFLEGQSRHYSVSMYAGVLDWYAGALISDIPSTNTTQPPSSVLWGSSVLPYSLMVQEDALTCTCAAYLLKMLGLSVLSGLTMGVLCTKRPPYELLNLYQACVHALGTPHSDRR